MNATPTNAPLFLEGAAGIARTLCGGAYWNAAGDECTWVGRTEIENSSAPAAGALGAHLYGGTAGVALFLAEMYALTGDADYARTARAALRRSFRYMRIVDRPISPLSVWAGSLGPAYAAARLEEHDPASAFRDEIDGVLDNVAAALEREHPLDVMGGTAGAVPVLLRLARIPGFERCRELALRGGEDLLATVEWQNETCAWSPAKAAGGSGAPTPPWTGFSHGASGFAAALLALFDTTGDDRFLATARGAIAYENELFNPEAGNWVDVRFPFTNANGTFTGSYQTAWCHGSPGIALTRLLAMRIDGERGDSYRPHADAALATTLTAIEQMVEQKGPDGTLCHGITGLGEVLLTASTMLGDDALRGAAERASLAMIERHAAAGDWPCGVAGGGIAQSLMIGTAGIGFHFLRLAAPAVVEPILMIDTDGEESRGDTGASLPGERRFHREVLAADAVSVA